MDTDTLIDIMAQGQTIDISISLSDNEMEIQIGDEETIGSKINISLDFSSKQVEDTMGSFWAKINLDPRFEGRNKKEIQEITEMINMWEKISKKTHVAIFDVPRKCGI